MNEDIKKNLRTQGKYSDKGNANYKEKRQKDDQSEKGPPEKRPQLSKNSDEPETQINPWTDTSDKDSSVKYEENSSYKFEKLEPKQSSELQISGLHVISETYNGISSILYEPNFIDLDEGNELYDYLMENAEWDQRDIIIRGAEYPQPRLVAWYGPFPYTYSGLTLEPAEIPDIILPVKQKIEDYLDKQNIKVEFNSVLMNYYRSGHDSVSWHSDDESSMGICPTIASISLGETRKFEMRRKKQSYEGEVSSEDVEHLYIHLKHGSLLTMNGVMQLDWQHRIPKEYHDKDGRINLTFRTVYSLEKDPPEANTRLNNRKSIEGNSSMKSSGEKSFSADDFPPLSSPVASSKEDLQCKKSSETGNIQRKDKNKSASPIDDSNRSQNHFSTLKSDVNNLNDKVSIGHPFDKNVNPNDNFARNIDETNCDSNIVGNNSTSDTADIETENYMKKFENKMYADKIQTNFNVEAPEFVPVSQSPVPTPKSNYKDLSFGDLIAVEVVAFNQQKFEEYTDAIKVKALENISEFNPFQKDEIMFLIDLIEGSKCEYTQKLARNRLVILTKRLHDKGFKRYSRNKQFHNSREDQFSNQRESHNPNQRQRFYGKPTNRDENSSHGDRFSNINSRKATGSQAERFPNYRKENYNQNEQWPVSHVNPKRNSKDDSAWNEEDFDRSNAPNAKDVAKWIEENLATVPISANYNVSNWIKNVSTNNTTHANPTEETCVDENLSKGNAAKSGDTREDQFIEGNTHDVKSEERWGDLNFDKGTQNKKDDPWDSDGFVKNNTDKGEATWDNNNTENEELHNNEGIGYSGNSDNRNRHFNKKDSWNDKPNRDDRYFNRNEGQFHRKNENTFERGKYANRLGGPSSKVVRHFNKDNKYPAQDDNTQPQRRFENTRRRGSSYGRGTTHLSRGNFNRSENQFNRDDHFEGERGYGARYKKNSPEYSKNNDDHYRERRDRRGQSSQGPRFSNRREESSSKEPESNNNDYGW